MPSLFRLLHKYRLWRMKRKNKEVAKFLQARLLRLLELHEARGLGDNSICDLVESQSYSVYDPKFAILQDMLRVAFLTWPRHSGNFSYPVPPDKVTTQGPRGAFDSIPLWQGEYGDNRYALLVHTEKVMQ